MTPAGAGIAGIALLFVLMALRVPIGFAMAFTGFLGVSVLNSPAAALGVLGMQPFQTAASYTLSIIPLFLLMGQFAFHSELGRDLYDAAYQWCGRLPGGLAASTIGACACFAAISGSSLATVAMFGVVAYPEMKQRAYPDALSLGSIAAGGALGILIPPSSVLILYGVLTQQSVVRLFIAGIGPGVLLALAFMITIFILSRKGVPAPSAERREKGKRLESLKKTWQVMALFFAVIGGLYAGWFTPIEAAGVGAFGAFLLMAVKGRMTWSRVRASLRETTSATAMIFMILIGAMIFQVFMTLSRIPDALAGRIIASGLGPHWIMGAVVLAFTVLGCFMEGLSIMMLAVPIVYPMVVQLGFDPIWFGVVITLTMEMSLITPPVGVNVFVLKGVVKDAPMDVIFRGVFPFFLAILAVILLLMAFPQIALFLPDAMMGRGV